MAIDPKLVSIKKASEIPTAVPTSAGLFFFFEGSQMKKARMTDIYDKVKTAYLGIATTTTTPPATGAYWYRVTEAGTYTNFLSGGSPIVVTEADLDIVNGVANNEVILEVNNGAASKKVRRVKGETGVGVVLDDQIKEMLLSESYIPQSATYTDGLINSPFNIIWANGATGVMTITRNTDELVTNISATHIKDMVTKNVTSDITRNTDGNATNITISII